MTHRKRQRAFACLLGLATLAVAMLMASAPPAHAGLQGYGKAVYTKGNSATFWWEWTRVNGLNENTQTDTRYYVCRDTYENNFKIESSSGIDGPFALGCTASLTPTSGNISFRPKNGTTLPDGARYDMCATQWNRYVYIWSQIGTSACLSSRIDRNKPTVAVSVNGTQEATRNPALTFQIGYSDTTSPPWPANYRCIKIGSPCTSADQFPYDSNCSVAQSPGQFTCSGDFTNQPDGKVYFCAAAADSAIPDNPSGPTYSPAPNSNNANISDFACGWVTLDRKAPTVTVNASATQVYVGDLVSVSASASDTGSGITGGYTWSWGDNTPDGAGAATAHTYTQPGTFQMVARIADKAGNTGQATRTITVTTRPTGGGGTDPGGGGTDPGTGGGGTDPGTGGGGTDPGAGGGTTTPPPTGPVPPPTGPVPPPTGTTGSPTPGTSTTGTVVPPPTGATGGAGATTGGTTTTVTGGTLDGPRTRAGLVKLAGGKTKATTYKVGGLRLMATKRVVLRKSPRLPLVLTPSTAGKVTLTLRRKGKRVARATVEVPSKRAYGLKMRLPKKTRTGAHRLTVSYKAAGAKKSASRSITVRFAKKGRASVAVAASRTPRITGGARHAPGEQPPIRQRTLRIG